MGVREELGDAKFGVKGEIVSTMLNFYDESDRQWLNYEGPLLNAISYEISDV